MGEVNSGLRVILKSNWIFNLYLKFVGVAKARKRIIDTYLSFPENCKVLDIGCASGEVIDQLPKYIQYTGIDINNISIEIAKQKYTDRGVFINIDVNDINELILKENEFDRILILGVLHHLDDVEVIKLLSTAHRLLRPGGVLFTIDGVYQEKQTKLKKYILSKDRGQFIRYRYQYEHLAKQVFQNPEAFIEKNALRIPTDYISMRMTK